MQQDADLKLKSLIERVDKLSGVVASLEALLCTSLKLDEEGYLRAQGLLGNFGYTDALTTDGVHPMGHQMPLALANEELHKIREIAEPIQSFRNKVATT